MTDNNVIETFIANGGAGIQYFDPQGIRVAVIGKDQRTVSLEEFADAPVRIRTERTFDDLRGFVAYVNEYKQDNTVLFAGKERLEAVIDYHAKGAPAWGAHKVTFNLHRSDRWKLWLSNNQKWMEQRDFADFLDTGLNEISEPSASVILDIVKNFRATTKAEVDAEIRGGNSNFTYREEVRGGTTKKTDIEVPEIIMVSLAPFQGLQALNDQIEAEADKIPVYSFKTKIAWRLNEQNKPVFKVQILHVERAIEETLESLRLALVSLTDCKVYIGG